MFKNFGKLEIIISIVFFLFLVGIIPVAIYQYLSESKECNFSCGEYKSKYVYDQSQITTYCYCFENNEWKIRSIK